TDLLRNLLRRSSDKKLLADAPDIKGVDGALDVFIPGPGIGRIYSRTNRDFEATYELLRQEKADQLQSIYGMLLSQLLGEIRDEETGELQIDFSTLAPFAGIREYLGMVGVVGKNRNNGWYVVIVALPPK
ncbi:MAG: hypothetical protein N2C12_14675, partial [Planctomycetales bacterium]